MKYLLSFIIVLTFISCEKDIEIDLPEAEEKIVVEGSIEQGLPPLVFLTKSTGFFEPTDFNTLRSLMIHDAVLTVFDGTVAVELIEICTDQLPVELLPDVADFLGVSLEVLQNFGICVYTTLDPNFIGEVGKTYDLTINVEGQILTSTTTIPPLVAPDEYWYKDQPGFSDQGFLWFSLNDPPEIGDAYRVFTKRIGKDDRFIPANGSVFNDDFFNGLDFEAFIFSGHATEGDQESGHFVQGDVIAIRFCTIDQPHFQFWNSYEVSIFNNGNPFAAPATIKTNIEGGGLGVWGGYGVSNDTIIAVDR